MVFVDQLGGIHYANPVAARLVGLTVGGLNGINVFSLVHLDDWDRVRRDFDDVVSGRESDEAVEYRIRAADNSWKTVRAIASNLLGLAGSEGILVSAIDVTDQRTQEVALRELAERDAITQLPNRLALRQYLDKAMASDGDLSVAFVDLDHFRRVNDCLGHNVGDQVLRAVAGRLRPFVPRRGLMAHFGADTFVVVWSDVGERFECELRLGTPLGPARRTFRRRSRTPSFGERRIGDTRRDFDT
jgi:PAS domain S-box-containing protein